MNQYHLTKLTLFYQVLISPNPLKAYRHTFQCIHCVISVRLIKAWSNACNISTQHLATLLHDVATCVERAGQTHATCRCLCAQGPGAQLLELALMPFVQQCCMNLVKRVQHHATSKMSTRKMRPFSNLIQHVATGWSNVCNMCRFPSLLRSAVTLRRSQFPPFFPIDRCNRWYFV